MLKLIGILIVIIGFTLKLDTIAVVLISGVATGLVANMGFINLLNVLGKAFVDTRYMTLFVLTLPVIGICERYGLKEKAIDLIKKASGLTTGRLLSMYLFIREVAAALSLRLGGHPQFIRPLINPMAQGAAISKYGEIANPSDEFREKQFKKIGGKIFLPSIIPKGNILAGVIAYCIGMALFTMIMGNGFAAFAVITAGIGVPFVFAQGANPAIAASLALTAGFCGTLMTPMAANFNVVPAALLEMKNKNKVITAQVPVAFALLIVHIILMYYWAF